MYIVETSKEFEDWIQDFPEGYVINRVSGTKARMHHGECGHFKGNKPGANLLNGRKVLSRDEATLRRW